jgi:hypothetical protein
MADFTIKQNDTYPPILTTVSDAAGPIDLTDATVEFWFRNPVTGVVRHAAATVLDQSGESKGKVQYDWVVGDTAMKGGFLFEVRVMFGGSLRMTLPIDGYFTLAVIDDIDEEND